MSFDPTDRYYTMAACGCLLDHGQWFACPAHRCPHDQHETKAPWCDACQAAPADLSDCVEETPYHPGLET